MYDLEEVKKDLSDWIIDTLSADNPAFSGMPACPFAKKALLGGRIEVQLAYPETDFNDAKELIASGKDVVAYVYDPTIITPKELTDMAMVYNKQYPDLVFLEDHPDEVEKVQDFICNQGKYACVFAAPRNGVLQAREYLKTTKYYDNWDEDYKQEVWSR